MSPKDLDDDTSSTTTFSSTSSDTTLLTARILQLESELGAALRENQMLQQRIESLDSDLSDEREMRMELAKANRALSDEVEELSKSLFMEASGMVEKEARARSVLEIRQQKLETELAHTRDQLNTQTAQLSELRQKLQASGSSLVLTDASYSTSNNSKLLAFKYYEDLFPEQKFCTGKRQALGSWDVIVKDIPEMYFEQFSNFVQLASSSYSSSSGSSASGGKKPAVSVSSLITDEKILSHPFMRGIFECDVEPCFRFNPYHPVKSKSFLRKLVLSLLGNTLCLERMSITELESLTISCSMPVSPTNSSNNGSGSNGKRTTLKSLLMTLSVTSLPDSITPATALTEEEEVEVEEKPKQPKCALCKSPLAFPAYRFRLSERDSHGWFSIDSHCRERIVAVGDLYAFIRHIRRGLYAHRPMADLYCELLHYLRHIYYARLGATSFYIRNDAEMMYTKIIRPDNK